MKYKTVGTIGQVFFKDEEWEIEKINVSCWYDGDKFRMTEEQTLKSVTNGYRTKHTMDVSSSFNQIKDFSGKVVEARKGHEIVGDLVLKDEIAFKDDKMYEVVQIDAELTKVGLVVDYVCKDYETKGIDLILRDKEACLQ